MYVYVYIHTCIRIYVDIHIYVYTRYPYCRSALIIVPRCSALYTYIVGYTVLDVLYKDLYICIYTYIYI